MQFFFLEGVAGSPHFGEELCSADAFTVYPLWVLPPLSNSWIIVIIWLYVALNGTPNIDCYWVGAVPNTYLMCARAGKVS